MRVVIDIQNELLLKLHQLDRLTNLSALWDFAVRRYQGYFFYYGSFYVLTCLHNQKGKMMTELNA